MPAQGGWRVGFKNIMKFNQALLAKQGWRLVKNDNSLLVRVLKGKYFPYTTFSNASKGNNLSWGWQSMLYGREILQIGERIGNGNSTSINQDKWIPSDPPSAGDTDRTLECNQHSYFVSDLIDDQLQ